MGLSSDCYFRVSYHYFSYLFLIHFAISYISLANLVVFTKFVFPFLFFTFVSLLPV